MKHLVLAAALSLPSLATAQTFTPIGQAVRVISERGQNLAVYKEAKITLTDDAAEPGDQLVMATGAGVRYKKVVVNVAVYAVASYLAEAKVDQQDPMSSVRQSPVKVLQMRFLRHVTQAEIRDAFIESLQTNSIDPKTPGIAALLNKIPAQIAAGSLATFYAYALSAEEDAVVIDFSGTKIRGQGKDLAAQFWSIWFGKPSDNNLATLKAKLIGGL